MIQTAKERLDKGGQRKATGIRLPQVSLDSLKKAPVIAVIVALLAAYPLLKRRRVSTALNEHQAQLVKLSPLKENFVIQKSRESLFEKKLKLKITLEAKQVKVAPILKEVIFNLPPQVRITFLSLKDTTVSLKGVAKSQSDFEKFLEDYSKLHFLSEPIPTNIKREKENTLFELTFKLKS